MLLIGFVAIWMAFLKIAYLGGGLHPDTLETWTKFALVKYPSGVGAVWCSNSASDAQILPFASKHEPIKARQGQHRQVAIDCGDEPSLPPSATP